MKIHIFGASGSGTTSLGKALADAIDYTHLDADDYYWEKTNPPFQIKVPLNLRNELITNDFKAKPNAIISGSMVSWGREWERAFDLVIFLYLPPKIRMERLKNREIERYGAEIKWEEERLADQKAFLDWASKYDDPNFTGRSFAIHQAWIKELNCPVLTLETTDSLEQCVSKVVEVIDSMNV